MAALTDDGLNTYCALLTSGGVDCWGYGYTGQLGDGISYATGNYGSASPVQVEGVGGTGTLSGVAALAGESNGNGYGSFCALLTSGWVDCWGWGYWGQLGNGTMPSSSDTPVQVVGVGGTGTLSGVAGLTDDGGLSYCAILTSEGWTAGALASVASSGTGSSTR